MGRRSLLPLLLAFLLPCSGNASSYWSTGPYLQVVSDTGSLLVNLALNDAPEWTIEWHHSVTGNLIRDNYRFEGGQMLLMSTQTPAFDAGLGHIPGRGKLGNAENGDYLISDIREPVPGNSYLLRVGSARVDHTIVHAGRRYSLSSLAAGQRVTIRIVEESDE